jgi:hypothetical protein
LFVVVSVMAWHSAQREAVAGAHLSPQVLLLRNLGRVFTYLSLAGLGFPRAGEACNLISAVFKYRFFISLARRGASSELVPQTFTL